MRQPRTPALVAAALILCTLAVVIPLLALQSGSTAKAATTTEAIVKHGAATTSQRLGSHDRAPHPTAAADASMLQPAPTQTDPTSLWASTPIPAVVAAAKAAKSNQALPTDYVPTLSALTPDTYNTPADCQPAFGSGVTSPKICHLGDPTSKKIVVVIGDSHAGMWDPAIINDAKAEGFAMVPLDKSGCQLTVYDINHNGWPCGSWYKWALAEDKKLHPVATIVSFLIKDGWEATPEKYVGTFKTILSQVQNPILIADMPYQNQQPATCLAAAGATQGTCSSTVPSTYVPFMKDLATMASAHHFPVIPTLQWFCADGRCPEVINNTLVMHDKDHFTEDFADDLTTVFSLALNPILDRYEGVNTTTTTTTAH